MIALRDIPIKRKVTLVILFATMVTLLLTSGGMFVFQLIRSRQEITRDLLAQGQILAANSTAALRFKDEPAATETLATLQAKPHILGASLHQADGELLARYGDENVAKLPPGNADGLRFQDSFVELIQPVNLNNKRIGTLCLRFDFRAMQREIILPYATILGSILLVSTLSAVLLSSWLQRVITLPILQLAATAKSVADNQDYSVRAANLGRDELGALTSAFNLMLARIQDQDVSLRHSEGRYRLLFERNPVPMFVYDTETLAYLAVNEVAVAHYGYAQEEFLRMTIMDLRPPEDVPALLVRLAAVDGPADCLREWRHRKKDGTLIAVETTAHLIEFLGRRARLVLAVDVTLRKQAEAALEHRFQVEKLISEISTNFINLSPGEIDAGIDRALGTISRFAGADRAFVFQFNGDDESAVAANVWSGEGFESPLTKAERAPDRHLPWWMARLRGAEAIHVPNVAGLPPEAAAEKEFFGSLGIQSLLAVPMLFGGRLTGLVCFDAVRAPKTWGDDEITLLRLAAQIFTNALERERAQIELESLHRQMLDISRRAGMAEVATGVLHNVGNVLNSVNVSVNLVTERLRQSRLGNVTKLSALLREHESNLVEFLANDPRGKQVPAYLQTLGLHLEQQQAHLAEEMSQLVKNVEHIKQIVSMQQNYAQVSGVTETLPLSQVVEDALRMTEPGMVRQGIRVLRQFEPVPPVSLDKHKTLQILINLIRNARHAVEVSGKTGSNVVLRINRNGSGRVRIEVQDNGVGIEAANLTRIFSHGFTTKKDGHGFGLHLSSLAAKEMGGELTLSSAGVGQGATFALELPLSRTAVAPALTV